MAKNYYRTLKFAIFICLLIDLSSGQRGRQLPTTTRPNRQLITNATTLRTSTTTKASAVVKPKSGAIVFPEDDVGVPVPLEIPLELRRELDNVADLAEFFEFIDDSTLEGVDLGLDGRTGSSSSGERDAAIPAKAASCIPEPQIVSLVETNDPSVLYYPSCTRVERCGGCCNSELLSCQPTKTETVIYQVLKTQYNGGSKMKYAGKEKISVEKHLGCKCQCRIKEQDCKGNQIYNPGGCKCECKNNDERLSCLAESGTRYWDTTMCMCKCRMDLYSSENCSTGFYFSDETCRCQPFPSLRRNDVWNHEDNLLPRNVPQLQTVEHVAATQPQERVVTTRVPKLIKKEENEEKEEKSAPMQRFTFVNNWRNQFFGRQTTPKHS